MNEQNHDQAVNMNANVQLTWRLRAIYYGLSRGSDRRHTMFAGKVVPSQPTEPARRNSGMRKLLALMVPLCGAASADAAEPEKYCYTS
jgi:hypothetical protein